ncbi:hypothetical protein AVEN_127034-1 [Araneus ventricosus]|uniref:Uncharacterized protein n=1 Tax=Araneus ventricosus TaxID=182803 RepID=A0A4Y2C0D6_ARAVE|nr:hypothetical protein AVEN_127034-1 [Araneus ventricosus]
MTITTKPHQHETPSDSVTRALQHDNTGCSDTRLQTQRVINGHQKRDKTVMHRGGANDFQLVKIAKIDCSTDAVLKGNDENDVNETITGVVSSGRLLTSRPIHIDLGRV